MATKNSLTFEQKLRVRLLERSRLAEEGIILINLISADQACEMPTSVMLT